MRERGADREENAATPTSGGRSGWVGYGDRTEPDGGHYEPLPSLPQVPLWLWRKMPRWGHIALVVVVAAAGAVLVASIPGIVAGKRKERREARLTEQSVRLRIARDQRPRAASLRASAPAVSQLERAILADARRRASAGTIEGPVVGVSCAPVAPPRAGRTAFDCHAEGRAFAYPFQGVTDTAHRTMTWCKRDPPPSGDQSLDVKVSKRCSL